MSLESDVCCGGEHRDGVGFEPKRSDDRRVLERALSFFIIKNRFRGEIPRTTLQPLSPVVFEIRISISRTTIKIYG